MKIVTIGRGNVGGGLAALWRKAGHEVTALGHDGGDASDADVVLVAVPGLPSRRRWARSPAWRARSPSTPPMPTRPATRPSRR